MSSYLFAVMIASVALVVLIVVLLRAVLAARRVEGLAAAYRRQLTAEVVRLRQRQAALLAELATRRGRARTMR